MVHAFKIAGPRRRFVGLVRGDVAVAVEDVDRRVVGVREGRDFDPVINAAGRAAVIFLLEGDGGIAGGVRGEDDIVAARIRSLRLRCPCRPDQV